MTSNDLRQKFLKFFEEREHKIVPSSSLIPDDPSVLLTTAGMQQFVPYLSGEVKPLYKRACSAQKCFRVKDLDEVGDDTHHTFFEMLGNWSFGDYFKQGAIEYALEFLTECDIPREKLAITIFKGEGKIPWDEKAFDLWIKAGFPKDKIFAFGMKENFWGPTAKTGPCGPSSELHYDKTGQPCEKGKKCGPNCSCGRYVEIWNLVFMEYFKNDKGEYEPLPQKNIDTGIGFERLLAILQNKKSAYETDLFLPLMKEIRKIMPKKKKLARIFADHIRAICFLIADGVTPSNVEQGYVLRRLLRRLIVQIKILNLKEKFLNSLIKIVIENYSDVYSELKQNEKNILQVIKNENEKFGPVFERGLKRFNKIIEIKESKFASEIAEGQKIPIRNLISVDDVFDLHSTYGFSVEIIKDLAHKKGFVVDKDFSKQFEKQRKKHQELSRAGAEKKFGGHGIGGEMRVFSKQDKEKAIKLHTATHLLHQALQDVLGSEARQMGSDITPERLRFDFGYPQKLTPEQIKKIEDIVNQKIKDNLPTSYEEMNKEEALKSGAKAFFKTKYGEKVKVYSINNYSREICAGPHVDRTGELGRFKITKEQSSSAGVRRIKAVLEER